MHDMNKGLKPMKSATHASTTTVKGAGNKTYSDHAKLAGTGKPNKKGL
jgi:hypothetical protein